MSIINTFIKHLGENSRIYSMREFDDLVSAEDHPGYMRTHRADLLLDRIRFLASLFSLLVPLWLVIDYLLLPLEVFWPIALIRLVSTAHFIFLSRYRAKDVNLKNSLLLLGSMMLNLPLTFFASTHYLVMLPPEDIYQLPVQLYTMLPYIAVGFLGLFPLTVLECATLALLLAMVTMTGWSFYDADPLNHLLPTLWMLCIILSIVLFAATLQLQYMIALITRADHDPVTGAQTRKSGIQSLAKAFQQAQIQNDNLSIALVDIDDAKSIISEYDYATYDHAVIEAADILRDGLRHNDMLVHWGEKVFLLILPGTDCEGSAITVRRIHSQGLGSLPDGSPVTASIGICERVADNIEEWSEMLTTVDARRDRAKSLGKDRYVLCGESGEALSEVGNA
ncbi:MAG: GGDEF domain-containing protein [Candidatus Thiodiazotropha sp. (ex Dulcina madagascariensis)]|nr:GGDEF domain-containing protein [Candidatus Thiodiazotropha sp. (ex Dulcina madagascariensis)]MCU7927745.1 GGDEF domain-containing protein [Candidatus Thiodiazotropha sp. (ex Dulcina madagascariensis)]